MALKAEIVSIGSELISGQSLDTNSRWLSGELGLLGIATAFHTTIGDDLDDNVAVFRIAAARADLVLTTGGLGPTQDDLTREALARAAGVGLREDAESLAAIAALFSSRNRPMADRNRNQAMLPEGAEALPNPIGTAPGIWMTIGAAAFGAMPGVPSEMRRMFHDQVVPRLRLRHWVERAIVHRRIALFGKGESDIEAEALDLTARGHVPEVGITAHDATISFRIRGEGLTPEAAWAQTEETAAMIRGRFGALVLGEGTTDVADALADELRRTGATLATAESCTGGLVAHLITAVPGVSPHYFGGVVSYANRAKTDFLDVPADLIQAHGAVSAEVAAAMARGARERFGVDLAISTTGVAGPGGGTAEKPVGLVYLGLASRDGVETRRVEIGPEQPRDVIQRRSSKQALNWVRTTLKTWPGQDGPR
ncbi:competence/damage-inducible protein A [Planctomyces sp. SH-PL62]|uniref:competence/damage-inducible protein A n=1 Tax=Planctomyces sp. SH-PL62 TaxID=1636152 RepID=UPI00078CF407|nr:competence/damage-inducible protein A [Planctomyces sp. SH-PL62]AMV36971.1 Nicotinamide-nucleotide amidohydrolase PncC [Planctomyces sp. SH-PL62]